MTTLAEDHDSWKASGLLRRDFRHTHNGPEVPRHRRRRSKAERKLCRGKYPHDFALVERSRAWVETCKLCGKHGGYIWKRNW